MTFILQKDSPDFSEVHNPLESIPEFSDFKNAHAWLKNALKTELPSKTAMTYVEWNDIAEQKDPLFGYYSVKNWQKFVLATYLADLISYDNPPDQVSFDRLAYVMHAFPQGFRTWFIELPNKTWLPVGYTAFYPMLDTAYELFTNSPERLKDRTVVPASTSSYLYLFNFSVHPKLKKSSLSKNLMTRYIDDISQQQAEGLACITVSEDGVRIAKRLGMAKRGTIGQENVYTTCSQKGPQ